MLASANTTTSTSPSIANPPSSLFSQDVVMAHETFGPMDIDQDEDVVMAHETFAPMDWMWT